MQYIIYILIALTTLTGGLAYQNVGGNEAVGLSTLRSIQLAPSPQADYILSTNGTSNAWIVNSGGGGSSLHVDGGGFVYPQTGDYHASPYYFSTSSTASTFTGGIVAQASSTFTGATTTFTGDIVMTHPYMLTAHGIRGDASDGTQIVANNGTQVATFGAGGGANSLFLGGLNIDGATRLATSITGPLQAISGAVTATSTIDQAFIDPNIARDSELHSAVTFAGTGTYISLSGQQITVDPITESDISDLTHASSTLLADSNTFSGNNVFSGSLTGTLTGNADTATALASNGANCSAGQSPLGVDTAGAVESCFDVWTEAENTSAGYFPLSTWFATTSAPHLTTLSNLSITQSQISDLVHASSTLLGDSNLFTGSNRFETAGTNTYFNLTKSSATVQAGIKLDNEVELPRFIIGLTSLATDDFFIGRYNESGTYQDAPIYIYGNTGLVNMATAVTLTGSASIPNGTNPTTDAVGEIAFDTTDDQLIVDDGTTDYVYRGEDVIFKVTIASTSPDFVSGGVIPIPPEKDGFTLTQYRCYVSSGTSVVINLSDGTNDTETITCATTLTSDTDVATNDTFTAGELAEIQFGTITGTPDYLSFTAYGVWTRE